MIRSGAVLSTSITRRSLLLAPIAVGGCAGALPYPKTSTSITRGLPPPPDLWLPASEGSLPARAWMPEGAPRAVVLALHGFNDSRDAWELAGPVFAASVVGPG